MAVYRNISMDFWTDSKVVDDFTPEDRYFHIYVLTNPHTNLCGCYEVSMKQIANETGYNTDTISRLIDRFQNVHKTLEYCKETKEILILNWFKYNWTASPKLDKPLLKDIEAIKNERFRNYVGALYNKREPVIPYQYPIDTTVSVSVSVSDSVSVSSKKARTRFVPPTVDEVAAYVAERKSKVDPQGFIDFYESKGWMVGRTKMVDWKAACRNAEGWERWNRATVGANGVPINKQKSDLEGVF